MDKRILVVDDEPSIIKGLVFSLSQEGYAIDAAYDGEEALEKFQNNEYDLVILDVMLPKMNGLEVLQRIREGSGIPVIMLTAKGEDMDKILGLEYGADDYITKPFNILELKARVKAVFRRLNTNSNENLIRVKNMTLNLANRSVTIDGKEVELTAKEFDLIQLFAKNPGKVYSRENLLETVWKYDYLGDLRTVDVHIRRLREKIEKDPGRPDLILTKWGVGYYFADK
ncbi:MAG: response regulator transcription factor [Caldicoprobacterales bacterium]|jgi:DNA-binding response OmpR family regulator|nr:response regulator transcription factor [Clostridia bacterium]MDI9512242.1 response regulator transcription factor [Bacillota bacterium]NLH59349.1 response regulator transcription factor [Clostridiales bacterium]